jgi:hypothetical protein
MKGRVGINSISSSSSESLFDPVHAAYTFCDYNSVLEAIILILLRDSNSYSILCLNIHLLA